MHGNPDFAAGLDLTNADRVVAEVLPPHPHYVGAPLTGIEQQRKGEACARADRMMSLELLDLALSPRVIALALSGRHLAHIAGRVLRPHSDLYGVLHQRPQRAAQCVGGPWGVGTGREKFDHMLALQECDALVAMLGT